MKTRASQPNLNEIRVWKKQEYPYPAMPKNIIVGLVPGTRNWEAREGAVTHRCDWCQVPMLVSPEQKAMAEICKGSYVVACAACVVAAYGTRQMHELAKAPITGGLWTP
jgi:hypothetical protein